MKKSLHKLYITLKVKIILCIESLHFLRLLNKHNASLRTDDNKSKMQYTILRENHIIEKGMSMRNPRKGFGQEKVNALLKRLDIYITKFGNEEINFVIDPLSTIKRYIDYTKQQGVEIDKIENNFINLVSKSKIANVEPKGGIKEVLKNEIIDKARGNFESLLYSRHSVRYFKNESVAREIIDNALRLAQKTPSACNRQAWLTHVFLDDKSYKLLKWQGGCNGFEDEIKCSILVTANLNAFLYHEPHQAYIDGGMYAMNLLNAFHSLGMVTIPLSCGFLSNKLNGLKSFNISESEVPIAIIGVGHPQDKYNVAISLRKEIIETNHYH